MRLEVLFFLLFFAFHSLFGSVRGNSSSTGGILGLAEITPSVRRGRRSTLLFEHKATDILYYFSD